MKKKHIIFSVVSIILIVVIIVIFKSSKKIKEDVQLKNQIIETIKKSDSIDLKEITNFKWDTMYVFTPYSNPRDILKEAKIKNYNLDFTVKYSDSIYMIAFINNNKLISFVELPNNYINIDKTVPVRFNRDDTKFNIYDKVMIIKGKSTGGKICYNKYNFQTLF